MFLKCRKFDTLEPSVALNSAIHQITEQNLSRET